MQLTLSFNEEGGTSRGGIDVWLQVELTTSMEPETEPGSKVEEQAGKAFDDWLAKAPTVKDGKFYEDGVEVCLDAEADADVWVEDGKVKTCSTEHYELSVSQPVDKVRELVCWLAQTGLNSGPPNYDSERHETEGEWTYSLRTRIYTLKAELFRDGNAE